MESRLQTVAQYCSVLYLSQRPRPSPASVTAKCRTSPFALCIARDVSRCARDILRRRAHPLRLPSTSGAAILAQSSPASVRCSTGPPPDPIVRSFPISGWIGPSYRITARSADFPLSPRKGTYCSIASQGQTRFYGTVRLSLIVNRRRGGARSVEVLKSDRSVLRVFGCTSVDAWP
ncbi:hypothetical protein BDW22DRAFT_429751 [Trametopsis cervina]|nr:hypothetical protein BDW22DRAFT_429751 [Trametopsis cervina]